MLFKQSWERHWRRRGTITDLETVDDMINAELENEEWERGNSHYIDADTEEKLYIPEEAHFKS